MRFAAAKIAPMNLHFDLTDLRLMVRVAEHNSLTAGAQAMGLSLPAASGRVRKLEDGAGTRLWRGSRNRRTT